MPADTPANQAAAAIARVAADLPAINKDERNTQQNFAFRSIDAITAAVRPLFGKHGLAVIPNVSDIAYETVTSRGGGAGYRCLATVDYLIVHESGDTLTARMVGEAVDYGDKSTSKAVQMAFKYLLTELLLVGSGDADPDSHTVADLDHAPKVDPAEALERATNALKADILALVGDREQAVAIWKQTTTALGFDPAGPIPTDAHPDVLALARTTAKAQTKAADQADLTASVASPLPVDDDTRPFTEGEE